MAYSAYPRRSHQRSAYTEPALIDVQQQYDEDDYPASAYPSQAYPQGYSQRGYSSYPARGRYDQSYTDVDPYYRDGRSRDYYPSSSYHGHSRRHNRDIIVGSTRDLPRYSTTQVSTSSSKYRAYGTSGKHIPVLSGRSRSYEDVPFSTRVLRLFGLGPKHHSHHHNVIHVKRGSRGIYTTSGRSGGHRVISL